MSGTLEQLQRLVLEGDIRISEHGYDELAADELSVSEVVSGIAAAILIEDYPSFAKGPCVLVLQRDNAARPIHVVWGIPAGNERPAVVVTAYRPDVNRWSPDFTRRL